MLVMKLNSLASMLCGYIMVHRPGARSSFFDLASCRIFFMQDVEFYSKQSLIPQDPRCAKLNMEYLDIAGDVFVVLWFEVKGRKDHLVDTITPSNQRSFTILHIHTSPSLAPSSLQYYNQITWSTIPSHCSSHV